MAHISQLQLAQYLSLSSPRISQLVAKGVLQKTHQGFDLGPSLMAYIQFLKRDETGSGVKTRHLLSRAINVEMKNSMMLRHLLTLDEVRELVGTFTDMAIALAQGESQRYFDSLNADDDATIRRAQTDKIWRKLRGCVLGWREGVTELLDKIEVDHMPKSHRLEDQLRRLMVTAMARLDTDPDDVPGSLAATVASEA
jgi:hypothetical protein